MAMKNPDAVSNKKFKAEGVVMVHYEMMVLAPDDQKAEEITQHFGELLAMGTIRVTKTVCTGTKIQEVFT